MSTACLELMARLELTWRVISCSTHGFLPLLRVMTWKARATSLLTSEKSAFNTAFLGLKTTSTDALSCSRCNRTASRILRLIRLRCTDPPNPRPTVKPILAARNSPAVAESLSRLAPDFSFNSRPKKNAVNNRPKCLCPCWYTRSKSACLSNRPGRETLRGTFRNPFCSANPVVAGSRDWRVVALTIIPRLAFNSGFRSSVTDGVYSRKPGFTDTRLRPLARRRERTARPLLVFIRSRNPCVFERRRRLGWNVRLGMNTCCSWLRF